MTLAPDRAGAARHHARAALRQARRQRAGPGGVQKKPRAAGGRRRLIRVSVAEVRRFFVALLWGTARVLIAHVLHWSNWRRHHQALAMFFHYKARNALDYIQL